MRFFITGGYAALNPGDLAILKSTVWRLHTLRSGSHFVIWCDKAFSPDLPSGVSSEVFIHRCPFFFMGSGHLQRTLMRLYLLFYPLSQALTRLARAGRDGRAARKMKECDAVLFIGGGYLNSLYPFDLLQMHHHACLARESGRPVYLLGQTVGPFRNRWFGRIADSIFAAASHIVTRERYSAEELARYGKKVTSGVDDAIDLGRVPASGTPERLQRHFERGDPSRLLLGLNLRTAEDSGEFYPQLVQILNRFNTEQAGGKMKVVFIPMQTSAHRDDREQAERFKRSGSLNFEFSAIREELSLEDRRWAVSRSDLFLGMRFHSLVFALTSAVPCIGLYSGGYYFRKNRGLLEIYGMEKYCLQADDLTGLPGLLADLKANDAPLRARLKEAHTRALAKQDQIYQALFG